MLKQCNCKQSSAGIQPGDCRTGNKRRLNLIRQVQRGILQIPRWILGSASRALHERGQLSLWGCGLSFPRLRGLDPSKTYKITFDNTNTPANMKGIDLINQGLSIRIAQPLRSELLLFEVE